MNGQRTLSGPRAVTVVGLGRGRGDRDPVGGGGRVPDLPAAGDHHPARRGHLREPGPLAVGAGRGSVPGVVRHRWLPGERWAAQPGWPGGNHCGHRHLDPDARCAHRPGRRGHGHAGQLPEPDAGSALRPDCGQGWSGAREPGGSGRREAAREDRTQPDRCAAHVSSAPEVLPSLAYTMCGWDPTVGGSHGEAVGRQSRPTKEHDP
jgi:hypothetical protein